MTKDEIIEMAYEAGIQEAFSLQHDQVLVQFQNGSLERFAALVEAKASEKEREWVGLTDEEKYEAEEGCSFMDDFDSFIYADNIEAKLKAKNERKEKNQGEG